jgi:hypothetical protein
MTYKPPSVWGFIFLLASIAFVYMMFLAPFATGAYYAFKDENYKEFSDGLIRKLKRKLKVF